MEYFLLFALAAPVGFRIKDAPEKILDLKAVSTTLTNAVLSWTVPASSSYPIYMLTEYDIRLSESPINSTNWSLCQKIPSPSPEKTGDSQLFTLNNLKPKTVYYLSVKSQDVRGVWSLPSNLIIFKTKTPLWPIVLSWPLQTPLKDKVVTAPFGEEREYDVENGNLVHKFHVGVDYRASPGTKVYAVEAGVVKENRDIKKGWAWRIVIEHVRPDGSKFTAVYLHITPNPYIKEGSFVPKGCYLSTVADLTPHDHDSHFHFGIMIGEYKKYLSGLGMLPNQYADYGKNWDDTIFPPYPGDFINPNDSNLIQFH